MTKPDTIRPVGSSKHIFMGLHGPPDAGKTRFVCSLPNTLLLRPPVEHTESVIGYAAKDVEEWKVGSWDEMSDDVLDYLRHEGHKHAFVWLDSISGWQDVGLDDVWEDTVAARPHRKKTPVDKGEYNANFVRLARFIRAAVTCDRFNFGFTAWPEELENPEGLTQAMPWIQGKNMANRMVGYMKIVGYLERVEAKQGMVRVLRFGEDKKFFTKDQIGLRENGYDKIVNPTMPKLMAAIEASRTAKASNSTTTARKRTTKRPVKKRARRRSE